MVKLSRSDDVLSRSLSDADSGGIPLRVGRSKAIEIEARVRSYPASGGSAVTKMKRDGFVGVTRNYERRRGEQCVTVLQLDLVGNYFPADSPDLVYGDSVRGLTDSERRGGARADQHRVVPRRSQDRLWQLLQPSVVCKMTVKHSRVGAEDDFVRSLRWRGLRAYWLSRPVCGGLESLGRERGAGYDAVVNRLAPE